MEKIIILLLFFGFLEALSAQDSESKSLSLLEAIEMAQQHSIAVKQASTRRTTGYWEWRSFRANYKPQINLAGTLPGFTRNSVEVVQPDGTIAFQSIAQNNVNVGLSLSQQISLTGATLFMGTNVQRFDDFDRNIKLYNGAPFQLGFIQPLFRFNKLKWDKKIEPLRYQESQQNYLAEMENVASNAVDFFFNLMIAQIDRHIAQTNMENTDTIYQITQEKFNLGKVSRNDMLQLRMEKLKAAKALAAAEQDLEIAGRQLKSFMGLQQDETWLLELPQVIPEISVPGEKALQEAFQNLPDAIAFQRRKLEADRAVAEAQGNNGFSAELVGSFGWNKSTDSFGEIYNQPQDQQSVFVQFSFPIMDWGRAKSQRETAEARKLLTLYEVEQDRIDLEQTILTELRLLQRFAKQLELNRETDEVAQLRYQIAQDRFLLGNLSITDLGIAIQEKDQAKRDYVRSIWDFWSSFYRIRALTLYDFSSNKKIQY